MCLLAVMHRTHPEAPLVVAANRDEDLSRPAVAMTTLQAGSPRIAGGRDLLAGGTWLAINEHGVMAGLTNRAGGAGPDGRRSRGELPLALAAHRDAVAAVAAFRSGFAPQDYRPAWLLVGDGHDLFSIDMTGGDAPVIQPLPAGNHVLENRAPGTRSPKVVHTEAALEASLSLHGDDLVRHLAGMLASHQVPAGADQPLPGEAASRSPRRQTACVHAGAYGTRSALIAVIGKAPRPLLWVADGPPCRTAMAPVSPLWDPAPAA